MSQVYQQAQAQAASLEATNGKSSDSSDSEAGPKPAASFMQEGLERAPSKEEKVRDDDDSEASDEEGQDELPCKF
jgi:hypothetical protein